MSKSFHDDELTEEVVLQFLNHTDETLVLLWVDFEGAEVEYAQLPAVASYKQGSYSTHVWRIRTTDGKLHSEYQGGFETGPIQDEAVLPHPTWGRYAKHGEALGMPIMAFECVSMEAVRIAEKVVTRMLELAPPSVVRNLNRFNSSVAIIGRDQVTTDIPAHHFMKHTKSGRDIDKTTRGLGGTRAVPVTSCGEENLLMQDDRHYPSENILVHEFSHAVMIIGLDHAQRHIIETLYQQARQSGQYDLGCYMMENADEYWAEGAQAWFEATIRTDVNSGISTRELVMERDPGLAAMLMEVYGNGPWRYPQDAPSSFRQKPPKQKEAGALRNAEGDPLLDPGAVGISTAMSMDRQGGTPRSAAMQALGWEACVGCMPGAWLGMCNPFAGGKGRAAALLHAD